MTLRDPAGAGAGARRLAGDARPCHIRTPHYLRGRPGVVLRHLGDFRNPEELAFARPAAVLPLYHVAFARHDIWPDAPDGEIVAELFGPWLLPA